ncbi:MAG: hypothetical protein H7062_01800 [Candidatus Saccharimonas sp.]|nr:hypothetical protein [Planctomycetaceae bacterium]
MPATAEEIVSAAIQLPESDRLAIVSQFLEIMGDEDHLPRVNDPDFVDELRRRRNDPADAVPWSQLRDEV